MAQDVNPSDQPDDIAQRRAGHVPELSVIAIMTLVLLLVVGVFVYRMSTRPAQPDAAVDRAPAAATGEKSPGGSDPQPKFDNTRDEIENRGAGEQKRTR